MSAAMAAIILSGISMIRADVAKTQRMRFHHTLAGWLFLAIAFVIVLYEWVFEER
jgi:hypothetical protein